MVLPGTKNSRSIPPERMEKYRQLFCRYDGSEKYVDALKALSGGKTEGYNFPQQSDGNKDKPEKSTFLQNFEKALPYMATSSHEWCQKGTGSENWWAKSSNDTTSDEPSYTMTRNFWSWALHFASLSNASINETYPLCSEISIWVDTASDVLGSQVGALILESKDDNGVHLLKKDTAKAGDPEDLLCEDGVLGKDPEDLFNYRFNVCTNALNNKEKARRQITVQDINDKDNPLLVRSMERICMDALEMTLSVDDLSVPVTEVGNMPAWSASNIGKDSKNEGLAGMGSKERLERLFNEQLRGVSWNDWIDDKDFCDPEGKWAGPLFAAYASILAASAIIATVLIWALRALLVTAAYTFILGPKPAIEGLKKAAKNFFDNIKKGKGPKGPKGGTPTGGGKAKEAPAAVPVPGADGVPVVTPAPADDGVAQPAPAPKKTEFAMPEFQPVFDPNPALVPVVAAEVGLLALLGMWALETVSKLNPQMAAFSLLPVDIFDQKFMMKDGKMVRASDQQL